MEFLVKHLLNIEIGWLEVDKFVCFQLQVLNRNYISKTALCLQPISFDTFHMGVQLEHI